MFTTCPHCFADLTYHWSNESIVCEHCYEFKIFWCMGDNIIIQWVTGDGAYQPIYYYSIDYAITPVKVSLFSTVEESYEMKVTDYPIVFDDLYKLFEFFHSVENGTNQEILFL